MPHIFEPAVSDLGKVPEPFHGLYSPQEDGSFAMDPQVYAHLDNSGLRGALDKERKNATAAKRALEAFNTLGETPEAIQAKLQEMQETMAKKDAHAGQFEKFKEELTRAKEGELRKKDEELVRMQSSLMEHLVNAEATRVLSEQKGSPALLLPIIQRSAKVMEENGKYVVRITDAEGDPRYTPSGTFMSLADLVSELKSHAEYGKAFEASGTTGSGTPPRGPSQAGRPGGSIRLTRAEAKDPAAYRKAREEAAKLGSTVEIID